MNNAVKWLLIGTGDIVRKRVGPALMGAAGGKLVGLCGGRDRAAALAQEYGGIAAFDNVSAALRECDADAVYVATPVHRHGEEALAALAAGKHVLVEKPLGLDGADARRMVDAAAKSRLRAGCAYYRRCYPRYKHLMDLLASGALGRILLVRTSSASWFNPEPGDPKCWRVRKQQSGGGPLADSGSHMLDLTIGLCGLPRSVCSHAETLVQQYEVEDTASLLMQFENGAHGLAHFGWGTRSFAHELEVIGSEGKVQWLPVDGGKAIVTLGRDVQQLDLPNAANVHEPLVADFNRAVLDGRDPIVPLAEAAKTNHLLDAVYRSAAAGECVRL